MSQPLIPFEQALKTLGDMFGSSWTPDRLNVVLRHEQGSMDQACDRILSHGDKDPQLLINELLGNTTTTTTTTTATTPTTRTRTAAHAAPPHPNESGGVIWCWKETPSQMYKHAVERIVGDPCDCWIRYDDFVAQELESAHQLQEQRCMLSGSYRVDFATMDQTNLSTGYNRKVQRLDPADTPIAAPAPPAAVSDAVYNMDGTRVYYENDTNNNNSIGAPSSGGEPIIMQATAIPETTVEVTPSAIPGAAAAPPAPPATTIPTPALSPTVPKIQNSTNAAATIGQTTTSHPTGISIAIARHDFRGDPAQGQLSFPAGAEILLLPSEESNGWRLGRYGNQQGWFPVSLVVNAQQQQQQQQQQRFSTPQQAARYPQATSSQPPASSRISSSDILQLYGGRPPTMNMGQPPAAAPPPQTMQQTMNHPQTPQQPFGQPQKMFAQQGAHPQAVFGQPMIPQQPVGGFPSPQPQASPPPQFHQSFQQQQQQQQQSFLPKPPPPHVKNNQGHLGPMAMMAQNSQRGFDGPTSNNSMNPVQMPPPPTQGYSQATPPPNPHPLQPRQMGQHMGQPQQQQQQMMPPSEKPSIPSPAVAPHGGESSSTPDTKATHDALSELDKEINELQCQMASLEKRVVSELVTRICCKLDGIDVQGSDELRNRRKLLIRKTESIEVAKDAAQQDPVGQHSQQQQQQRQQQGGIPPQPQHTVAPPQLNHQSLGNLEAKLDFAGPPHQGQLHQSLPPQVQQQQPYGAAFPQPLQHHVPGFPSQQQYAAAPPQSFPNLGPQQPPPQYQMASSAQNSPFPMPAPMQGNHQARFQQQPQPSSDGQNLPMPQVMGQQPPQQPQVRHEKLSIPSPEELAPTAIVVNAADATTAVHEALSELGTQIDALEAKKGSMEHRMMSELVTRICCKLDNIDMQGSDQILRNRRKQLIRKAESIDSKDLSNDTPIPANGSGTAYPLVQSADKSGDVRPVANKLEMSAIEDSRKAATSVESTHELSRSLMPSPKVTADHPSTITSSDILQMYSAADPSQLVGPPDVHSPEQPPLVDVDLLDLGTSPAPAVAPVEGPIAPPPAHAPPMPPMYGDLLDVNTSTFVAAPVPFGAPPGQTMLQPTEPVDLITSPSSATVSLSSQSPNFASDINSRPKHRHRSLAVAQFAYSGDTSQKQLSFPVGAQISVLSEDNSNNGWKHGKYGDQKGWFPAAYVIMQPVDEQVHSNQGMLQQQSSSQQTYDHSMSASSNVDDMVSDFATEDVMGGTSKTAHPSIATLNHCPWQTEQQVALLLSPDATTTPAIKPKKKKKSISAHGTATTTTKNKAKGKKQTKTSAVSQQEVKSDSAQGSRQVQDETLPSPPASNGNMNTPQTQKKNKKKKAVKPAVQAPEIQEAEEEPSQGPINRAPPQFEIRNAERDSYDSDGSQESHEFEVMGGAGEQLFWQRQASKTADANPPVKKKKKKSKTKPNQEGETGINFEQTPNAATKSGGGAQLKIEKSVKEKPVKKKQVAAAEGVDSTCDQSGKAAAARPTKLKKNQSKKKLVSETEVVLDSTAEQAANTNRPTKLKKNQSTKNIVSESEVMTCLTEHMAGNTISAGNPKETPKDTTGTSKKQRKSLKKKIFGRA
jgi:hypothetical protein